MNSDFVAKYLELVQISVSKIDTTLLVEPGKEWGNESTLHYELFRDGRRLLPDFEIFNFIPQNEEEASKYIETMFRKYLQSSILA